MSPPKKFQIRQLVRSEQNVRITDLHPRASVILAITVINAITLKKEKLNKKSLLSEDPCLFYFSSHLIKAN